MKTEDLESLQDPEAGSERCNTDPAKCIELSNGIKIINLSVDSLYVSFNGDLKPGVLEYLETVKQEAISNCQPSFGYEYPGGILVIQPHGSKGYSYLLDGEDFSIKVGEGKVGPAVYSEIRAHYLYSLGFVEACKSVIKIIEELTDIGGFLVSRIDLCADLVGWTPSIDMDNMVLTRARKRDIHLDGTKLTGFSYGKGGSISCRIYDKTTQVKAKGNPWIHEVWKHNGFDDLSKDVWRIEFQLRREFIKEFNIHMPEQVFNSLNSLWRYCLQDWLSLRIPIQSDDTKSRWPIDPWWIDLSKLPFCAIEVEVVRDRYKAIQFEKIIDGIIAYQSSLGAFTGIYDLNEVKRIVSPLAEQRLDSRNKTFGEIVEGKRKRKGLVG